MAQNFRAKVDAAYDHAAQMQKSPVLRKLPAYWDKYQGWPLQAGVRSPDAVDAEQAAGDYRRS